MKVFLTVCLLFSIAACSIAPTGSSSQSSGSTTKTLTIKNMSSYDIDGVVWYDSYGTAYGFGTDYLWDSALGEYQYGIASGSQATRTVKSGSSYVYFYFTTGLIEYKTQELVSVGSSSVTFTFYNSTSIYNASIMTSMTKK